MHRRFILQLFGERCAFRICRRYRSDARGLFRLRGWDFLILTVDCIHCLMISEVCINSVVGEIFMAFHRSGYNRLYLEAGTIGFAGKSNLL